MSELEVRLIRHAKGKHMLDPSVIVGRSIEAELTDDGWAEADLKGQELANRGVAPDHIASSSATRCIQTGRKILDAMGRAEEFDEITDELLEMDQAGFVGRKKTDVYTDKVKRQMVQDGKNFALPGCETMNDVERRGFDWLRAQERLIAQGKLSVLAIAHAGLITHTVGRIEHWDRLKSLERMRAMPTVGETRLVFDGEKWHVDTFAQPLQGV